MLLVQTVAILSYQDSKWGFLSLCYCQEAAAQTAKSQTSVNLSMHAANFPLRPILLSKNVPLANRSGKIQFENIVNANEYDRRWQTCRHAWRGYESNTLETTQRRYWLHGNSIWLHAGVTNQDCFARCHMTRRRGRRMSSYQSGAEKKPRRHRTSVIL